MAGHNYYLLSALPGLNELGGVPPIRPAEMLTHVVEAAEASADLVRMIFLSDDLLQWQAFQAKEVETLDLAVLSANQGRGEEPLPVFLHGESDDSGQQKIALDATWQNFFEHAASIARRQGSGLLSAWVGYEVALRNALVVARSKGLNLDPHDYLVATELAGDEDFSTLVTEWSAASDPLAGQRVLDQARWQWLQDNDAWFSFKDDELVAYAAKLILLERWHRLGKEQADRAKVTQAE